ncbi:hypothetical protein VD0004_g8845 [Verticillium dahliae]|nr:hypothetical protein VD0004_g8845 [Verticillium dahliae]PNH64418.1 hypothetical protein VD0001_g8839 [Verticillium dahliae]
MARAAHTLDIFWCYAVAIVTDLNFTEGIGRYEHFDRSGPCIKCVIK